MTFRRKAKSWKKSWKKAEFEAEIEIRDSQNESEGEEQVITDDMIKEARLTQLLKNSFTHATMIVTSGCWIRKRQRTLPT